VLTWKANGSPVENSEAECKLALVCLEEEALEVCHPRVEQQQQQQKFVCLREKGCAGSSTACA
jgi:hypothetical protein